MSYSYDRTASMTKLPKKPVSAEVPVEVTFQVFWERAKQTGKTKRNVQFMTDAEVVAPAVIEARGQKRKFEVTYWTTLIHGEIIHTVLFWVGTNLDSFWGTLFEGALHDSGVERTYGGSMKHR